MAINTARLRAASAAWWTLTLVMIADVVLAIRMYPEERDLRFWLSLLFTGTPILALSIIVAAGMPRRWAMNTGIGFLSILIFMLGVGAMVTYSYHSPAESNPLTFMGILRLLTGALILVTLGVTLYARLSVRPA